MIIDAHVHVIAADTELYPQHGVPSGEPSPKWVQPPLTVERFLAEMLDARVDGAVLVQPMNVYVDHNEYVLAAAATNPERFLPVVHPSLGGDLAQGLRDLVDAGAQGVRLSGAGQASLNEPRVMNLLSLVNDLRLPVVVAVPSEKKFPELRSLLASFPELNFILDHCGFPDISGDPPYLVSDALLRLGEHENLYLKVTNLVLDELCDPGEFLRIIYDAYGGKRLMWGSNYPNTFDRRYADMLGWTRHACLSLPAEDQARFLSGNALKFWPLPIAHGAANALPAQET